MCDQLAESSNSAQYFLNPTQNMAAAAMMLCSIPESSKPEAKTMYRNLHNLLEGAVVQQAKVDRQFSLGTESHGPQTASSWSMGAQPTRSTRTCFPMRDCIENIHDARCILDNRRREQEEIEQTREMRCEHSTGPLGPRSHAFGQEIIKA